MKNLWQWIKDFGAWWAVVFFVMAFVLTFLPRCVRAGDAPYFEVQSGAKIVRGETWAAAALIYFPRVVNGKADVRCRILVYGPSNLGPVTVHAPPNMVWIDANGKAYSSYQLDRHQDQDAQVGCQLLSGYRRVDLGLGVQDIFRTDLQNAGGAAFWLTLRYRVTDHLGLEYSHSSNMGTKSPNLGSDFILASWRF